MTRWPMVVQTLALGALTSVAAAQPRPPAHRAVTYAQRLVDRFVASHRDLVAVELAVDSGGACRTIAATDRKDIGEGCDADELGPIRTGEPDVEAPTREDPVYDITQALHDAAGRLIGAVGMDLRPRPGQDRAAVVSRARTILRELEAQIPSKQELFRIEGR